jgi:hypothetical protein
MVLAGGADTHGFSLLDGDSDEMLTSLQTGGVKRPLTAAAARVPSSRVSPA